MSFKKILIFSVILSGATAMAAQIIFLREFLGVFYGNEISIGMILFSWLICGALGSFFSSRISDRITGKCTVFAVCQILIAIMLPAALIAIRMSRSVMGIATGEIIGYLPVLLSSFIILFLPCSILGFMFGLACRIYKDAACDDSKAITAIYLLEAVGAMIGGLLVGYFMVLYLPAINIILILAVLSLFAAILIQAFGSDGFPITRKIVISISTCAFCVYMVFILTGGSAFLDKISNAVLWKGYDVLETRQSLYGKLTVTKRGGQISFYNNGLYLYSVPDLISAEEAVHFPMLQNKDPKEILLIGGGVGGLLKEALKYDVKRVDYVEIDPEIIKLAEEFLPEEEKKVLKDPDVNVINLDGRFFVKRTANKYDCVIINVGDPLTAQLNRFYTVEFFRELTRILRSGAVVGFSLTSSENYMSDESRDYLSSIYFSAKQVFPEVFIIPGDTMHFLLSNKKGTLTYDVGTLMGRMKERGIEAYYVQDYYLDDKLSAERIEYAVRGLNDATAVVLDRDFRPVSYYFSSVFWNTHFDSSVLSGFFLSMNGPKIWQGVGLICLVLLGGVIFLKKRNRNALVIAAVMTTGFAEIVFQICIVISFQVIYGYVFARLGVIFTSFMVGLAAGGWIFYKIAGRIKDLYSFFSKLQISIVFYPLCLPVMFLMVSRTGSGFLYWLGANVIFVLLPAVAGIIGGLQFPAANKICLDDLEHVREEKTANVSGLSYSMDLFGAATGALLCAAILIPIIGIFQTCFVAAFFNLAILLILPRRCEKSGI